MPTAINASRTALLKHSLRTSLYLAAAMACLLPALAEAQSWNPTASDANSNTAAGTGALPNHLTGNGHNTAIGANTLNANTTGENNTATGYFALNGNTTGRQNVAFGFAALESNTTGVNNTALGTQALIQSTTGFSNTACGAFALTDTTTGNNNTAVGESALFENTAGSNNAAFGFLALTRLMAGGNNIALGTGAGKLLTAGSRNIYIGHDGVANESSVLRIGQTQTKTFIAGIAGVAASGATVVVKANGQLGVVASSARYKTDIHDLTDSSNRLAQLHPVSYQYKTEPGVTHFGLIAEEVDKVMPELVVRDDQNRPETVQYHELIPLLLARLNRQDETIERLKVELAELRRTRFAATTSAK